MNEAKPLVLYVLQVVIGKLVGCVKGRQGHGLEMAPGTARQQLEHLFKNPLNVGQLAYHATRRLMVL